jgi:Leucine-rich repeat (LRR) protein
LRYLGLGVGGQGITSLPEQIEELENLETLDTSRTRVMKLDVNKDGGASPRYGCQAAISGVENMKELQELPMVEVSDDDSTPQSVQKLGESWRC